MGVRGVPPTSCLYGRRRKPAVYTNNMLVYPQRVVTRTQFFALTGHANTEYCDRPLDSEGHTCKEMGALRLWEKKKAETPALKAYSKEYKRRFAWIKYGKIPKEAFYEWAEEARKRRDLCVKGEISVEDFKLWLEK